MKIFFLIILFFSLWQSEKPYNKLPQPGTSFSNNSLPVKGKIKVFVVFIQFKDDTVSSTEWPLNTYPSWANDFVSPDGNGPFAYNNLSQYFFEMSFGKFTVEGDVYDSLIITERNEAEYKTIGEVNYEILTAIDEQVDFSGYDNLNGKDFGHDGAVDFIYMIYRNSTILISDYTGIAHLEVSDTIFTDDGLLIKSGGSGLFGIGSGIQQRGGFSGRDYTLYVSAHEMGHYLFGAIHISGVSNLALMTGGPAWNASRGMHSWEKERLNWITFSDIKSDTSFYISDYMTTGYTFRVLLSLSEYFLIENRQKISVHDHAGDKGIYIYHVTNGAGAMPNIDVECADGNWNFLIDTLSRSLTRTTPNVKGKNELNFFREINKNKYLCYSPVYHENAAWGDDEDAFDINFNKMFSPESNPSSLNGKGIRFTVELINRDTNNNYTIRVEYH